MTDYATTVTARKPFRCECSFCNLFIGRGSEYVRLVAFPDGDINTSDRPWVMRMAVRCWRRYEPKPLPPRRRSRARA